VARSIGILAIIWRRLWPALASRDIETNAERYEAIIAESEAAEKRAGQWSVPLMAFENAPFFGQDRFEVLKWRLAQKGLKRRA
jgi:2-hydroxychromene-2-carboxylate isomerase